MDAKPLEMMQVLGRSQRYSRAIHILCAPTSDEDVLVVHHPAAVGEDLLRLQRIALVGGVAFQFIVDKAPDGVTAAAVTAAGVGGDAGQ